MNDIRKVSPVSNDGPGENVDIAAQRQQLEELASVVKVQAQRVIGKIPLLGAVCWLMMQQSTSRHTLLSELEWRVMPALVLDQAKLYMREGAPVAYVSWALLSEEAAQRYKTAPHHLTAADWQSGSQVWLVDLYAPFGGAQDVMNDLQKSVFAGQNIHRLQMDSAG